MKMTRAMKMFGKITIVLCIWLVCFLKFKDDLKPQKFAYYALMAFPLEWLFVYGLYLLSKVIYGVVTFNDCDEAYGEVLDHVKEAKEFYKKNNVDITYKKDA